MGTVSIRQHEFSLTYTRRTTLIKYIAVKIRQYKIAPEASTPIYIFIAAKVNNTLTKKNYYTISVPYRAVTIDLTI